MKPIRLLACLAMCLLPIVAAEAAPAVPKKAKVVFADDFDNGQARAWRGGKIAAAKPADTKGALAATPDRLILSRNVTFKTTDQTYLTFRYWAENAYGLCAQFGNRTRGDNFKTFIRPIRRGRWTTATFNITADIQGCGNHTAGIRAGDELSGLTLWPAERLGGAKFIIDDVAVYHMGPQALAAQAARDLAQAAKKYEPRGPMSDRVARTHTALNAAKDKDAASLCDRTEKLIAGMKWAHLLGQMRRVHGRGIGYAVGIESPLVRVSDRNRAMGFRGRIDTACRLSAAGHEYANVQLVVIPVEADLKQVKVAFTDLAGKAGRIDKKHLEWRLAEDVKTKPSYGYPRGVHGWKPDPILPGAPFDLKVGRMRAVWVTAYVPPETKPGDYAGKITISPADEKPAAVALNLRVWNYRLPLRGRFRHMCQFSPQSNAKRRENYAFMLKYRFSPTAQYSRSPTPVAEDIQFCLDRGITTFVAGNHPGPTVNTAVVQPYYEALKKAGCVDLAVIYIGDEGTSAKALAGYRAKATTVKKRFPGLRAMVGGSTPRKELNGFIDVWDPIMSMTAGRGSGYQYNRQAVEERKALGEEFLWYMAGVRPPYPSIELDPPATSIRMFCWVTFKYDIGGWELYGTQGGWRKATNRTWPKTPWDTYTWRNYNGSGQFVYPGLDGVPLASIRLENARDGIEDYESLALLGEAIDACKQSKPAAIKPADLARFGQLLAIRPEVVTDMWDWTRDPKAIAAARDEVSAAIETAVNAIGREKFDAFVAARAKARRQANNASYDKRLKAFLARQAATAPTGGGGNRN